MITLTRYSSFEDLKASKDAIPPQKSYSELASELKELIALLQQSTLVKSEKCLNQMNRGK